MPAFTKFVYLFLNDGIVDLIHRREYHIDHLSKKAAANLLSNSLLPTTIHFAEVWSLMCQKLYLLFKLAVSLGPC